MSSVFVSEMDPDLPTIRDEDGTLNSSQKFELCLRLQSRSVFIYGETRAWERWSCISEMNTKFYLFHIFSNWESYQISIPGAGLGGTAQPTHTHAWPFSSLHSALPQLYCTNDSTYSPAESGSRGSPLTGLPRENWSKGPGLVQIHMHVPGSWHKSCIWGGFLPIWNFCFTFLQWSGCWDRDILSPYPLNNHKKATGGSENLHF